MKLAAIDLGSNAIRLLISEVEDDNEIVYYRKLNLVRVPIRLGLDVFNGGIISLEKQTMMKNTLLSYKHLLDAYEVEHLTTAASSAMRDAKNGEKVKLFLKRITGIDLKIISGEEEANILLQSTLSSFNKAHKDTIYIDVGGGSTEITVKQNGKVTNRKSFNIGTLRLMNNQVNLNVWKELEKFLLKYSNKKFDLVGTGGNINKTFSLLKIAEGKPIRRKILDKFYHSLAKLSVSERMNKYNLREDRADVIVPALSIYLFVMQKLYSDEIYVPKVGLADGLIHNLYQELKSKP